MAQGFQNMQQAAPVCPPAAPLIDSKSLITTTKGWDLRIFRDEHLAQRFVCKLCGNVCRDAHELSCSSAHLFCSQCITEYCTLNGQQSESTTCPVCHEMNVTHQASRFVTRHIKELQVSCPRSKLVCSKLMKHARFNSNTLFCNFTGTLQELVQHTSSQCMFNVICCPFHLIGCPCDKLYRFELQKHLNAAQNKHISLALQKIQRLQTALKSKEDSNDIYQEQLRALKAASRAKDASIEKLSMDNERLSGNATRMATEAQRMTASLHSANARMESYAKAVALLKQNNGALAAKVDALSEEKKQWQVNAQLNRSYSQNQSQIGSNANGNE